MNEQNSPEKNVPLSCQDTITSMALLNNVVTPISLSITGFSRTHIYNTINSMLERNQLQENTVTFRFKKTKNEYTRTYYTLTSSYIKECIRNENPPEALKWITAINIDDLTKPIAVKGSYSNCDKETLVRFLALAEAQAFATKLGCKVSPLYLTSPTGKASNGSINLLSYLVAGAFSQSPEYNRSDDLVYYNSKSIKGSLIVSETDTRSSVNIHIDQMRSRFLGFCGSPKRNLLIYRIDHDGFVWHNFTATNETDSAKPLIVASKATAVNPENMLAIGKCFLAISNTVNTFRKALQDTQHRRNGVDLCKNADAFYITDYSLAGLDYVQRLMNKTDKEWLRETYDWLLNHSAVTSVSGEETVTVANTAKGKIKVKKKSGVSEPVTFAATTYYNEATGREDAAYYDNVLNALHTNKGNPVYIGNNLNLVRAKQFIEEAQKLEYAATQPCVVCYPWQVEYYKAIFDYYGLLNYDFYEI